MSAAGPLLRDIHLPPAAWWPLAPGWWLLVAGLLLVAVAIGARRWQRSRNGALRVALSEIDALEARHARGDDVRAWIEDASRLLRRIARRVEPTVASRPGDAWREFVHRHARDANARQALDSLLDARFCARAELDVPVVLTALRAWCRDALRARPAARVARSPARGAAR